MNQKYLIVGRSSSGKSSIAREVCNRLGWKLVKSYTTRPPRQNEADENSDHYFIRDCDVDQYKDDIIAYTKINSYQYFATKEELDSSDMYVIDPKGIQSLLEKCGEEYEFEIIYIFTPPELAIERAKNRGDKLITYQNRIQDEDAMFSKFESEKSWHYLLLNNGSFDDAVKNMMEYLERSDKHTETKTDYRL